MSKISVLIQFVLLLSLQLSNNGEENTGEVEDFDKEEIKKLRSSFYKNLDYSSCSLASTNFVLSASFGIMSSDNFLYSIGIIQF